MKRTATVGLILVLILGMGLFVLGAEDKKTNQLLEAALTKETIEGDLKGAIALYEQAVKEAGPNRALAVKAQMRLASAYQKQGNQQALAIYERVARDYADLSEAVEAHLRLIALKGATSAAQCGSCHKDKMVVVDGGKLVAPPPQPAPARVINLRQITLFDRQGKMLGTVGDAGPNGTMSLSPDGTRVALVRDGAIRVYDVKTQSFVRLTEGPIDNQPTWSSDGKRIAFEVRSSRPGRERGFYITSSDGTGREEFIAPVTGVTLVGWSPDGRYLTFQKTEPQTGADVWVLPVTGSRSPIAVLDSPAPEMGMRVSPDGRYMSYRLNEKTTVVSPDSTTTFDRTDVYVSPFTFPPNSDPSNVLERWRISTGPGVGIAGVRWRADGKELYYIDVNGGVTAVDVTTTPTFKAGTPRVLFQAPQTYRSARDTTAGFSDVSANGQIFALMVPQQ